MVSSFLGFGYKRLNLLLKYFKKPQNVWGASKTDLLKIGLSEKLVYEFMKHKGRFDAKNYFNQLNKLGIEAITINESKYPKYLKTIPSPPMVLYIKGAIKRRDQNAIAIVGSRNMTEYGKGVAREFSKELCLKGGLTIVSGLARGIDTEAHKGALSVSGRTIAVLGCGIDRMYPPENLYLAKKISKNGAVISEYPLGYPPYPSNFAARNRIISGLSKAVLVVEGKRKSGTFLTVGHALDQGKTVFAIPGQINSPLSEAPHYLIQNGAIMATSPNDILEEMDLLKTNTS